MAENRVEGTEGFDRGPDGELTAVGQAQRWAQEFASARTPKFKKWHSQGDKIIDRYLDERDRDSTDESRLNLFTANVETQHSMLIGRIPSADVARRFEDPADDPARVAAEMLQRLLTPLSGDDPYVVALGYALEDRLLPGFGFACARYEVETECCMDETTGEPMMDEAGEPVEAKASENVATDWHYWKTCLWSECRTFEEARWFAWSSPMTQESGQERFGDIFKLIPTGSKKGDGSGATKGDPRPLADVWEIWSKEDRKVYWLVEGFSQILDQRDDPLGLSCFYPFPKPMVARATTRNFMPRPDFVMGQDLYNEIDALTTRIGLLEKAIRVAGVYDKGSPEVAQLLTDAGFNKLYPAANWAMVVEKGGIKGMVDWFPLEQVVKAIAVLTEKRAEKIGLLQQVTGWADIMRGQSNPNETLGAQQLKSQYGSVRIQRMQNEVARFATDLQRIRAEIISKHFSVETIIERSNVMRTADARFAIPAAQLIKDKLSAYRIEVKPEAINLTDYASLKQERTEVITSLGGLMQAMTPLIQAGGAPAAEFALAAGAWMLAGVKGGDSLEAEFDAFRAKVQQAAMAPKPPPTPDPKVLAAQEKAKAEGVRAQVDIAKAGMDLKTAQVEHGARMQEIQAETVQAQVQNQGELIRAASRGTVPVGP